MTNDDKNRLAKALADAFAYESVREVQDPEEADMHANRQALSLMRRGEYLTVHDAGCPKGRGCKCEPVQCYWPGFEKVARG